MLARGRANEVELSKEEVALVDAEGAQPFAPGRDTGGVPGVREQLTPSVQLQSCRELPDLLLRWLRRRLLLLLLLLPLPLPLLVLPLLWWLRVGRGCGGIGLPGVAGPRIL